MLAKKNSDYQRILQKARNDLGAAYKEREALERRIAQLRQTVVTLGAMVGDKPVNEFGWAVSRNSNLTEAVRNVVVASFAPLDATEIRAVLVDLGYRFQTTNALASIHSVVKRLVEQKELTVVRRVKDGKPSRESAFWFGDPSYLEHWVEASLLTWDGSKREWVLKKKE